LISNQGDSVIRTVEELSMNAWPALQTSVYDGWLLRFARGYTRRANSVNPIYPSERNTIEKISFCEETYRAQGLPTIFKLTAASQPQDLDTLLAERGYQADARTSVQLLDLGRWNYDAAADISLAQSETEEWSAAFCRMSGIGQTHQATHRQVLTAIMPAKCFASINVDGRVVGCGLGVMQAGFMGLFDIVIDPGCRRRGYGERLVQNLLAWGKRQGAHTAYLQVMLNNAPALRLYARAGFLEEYQYWYRLKQ
jgi:N-acetylglutamate synthase